MATSIQRPTRQQLYRFALIAAFAIGFFGAILALGPTATGAQASVTLDEMNVDGTNKTIDGDVSDVLVDTQVNYDHDVPDATQRVVTLKAGPSEGDLETVDYRVFQDPDGTAEGSVGLAGSAVDETSLTAEDFNPALASTQSTDIVVQAVIEIERENGETVTRTVTDTVTITLTDGATIDASVGGEGHTAVETTT